MTWQPRFESGENLRDVVDAENGESSDVDDAAEELPCAH